MKKNTISKITYLTNSILFLIAGITIILLNNTYLTLFHLITSILLVNLGFITFILNLIKNNKSKDTLISITTLIVGLFFFNNKERFLSLFPFLFGIYMLINGIGKFLSYIIFKNKEKQNYYIVLIGSLIDFIFSYTMISKPKENIERLAIYLGIYLILFSITYFNDFLKEQFPKVKNKKRRFRITLPILFATFIPYRVLQYLNKIIDQLDNTKLISNKKTSGNKDLEILIHVREDNIGKWGHADLCYNNTIYSYGCYDEESKKLLKSLGDGTLFEIKGKEKYINYCNNNSNKTIFCYGITLNEEEKKEIEKKIKEIKKNTYKWNPNNLGKEKENTYAIELTNVAKAKFYKFKNTNYKTYFLLSTNCVKLVDDILGTTGTDILKINGVITPGVYYEYLDKEYKRKNSNVISKEIYFPSNKK